MTYFRNFHTLNPLSRHDVKSNDLVAPGCDILFQRVAQSLKWKADVHREHKQIWSNSTTIFQRNFSTTMVEAWRDDGCTAGQPPRFSPHAERLPACLGGGGPRCDGTVYGVCDCARYSNIYFTFQACFPILFWGGLAIVDPWALLLVDPVQNYQSTLTPSDWCALSVLNGIVVVVPGCSEILGIVSRESSAAASRSHGSGDENFRLFPSSTLCCWEATERKNLIKVQGLVDGIFAARRTVPCQIHQNRVDLRRFWLSKQGHPNHICWLLYVPL